MNYSTIWWSLQFIYRPLEDERLSWPRRLTYSGRFTHINGYPSAAGPVQTSESLPIRDRRSTTEPPDQPLWWKTSTSTSLCLLSGCDLVTDWTWSCDGRQHGGLTELNSRLVESLQLYHSLMQELPTYSQPVVHNMPTTYMSLSQVTTVFTASTMHIAQS